MVKGGSTSMLYEQDNMPKPVEEEYIPKRRKSEGTIYFDYREPPKSSYDANILSNTYSRNFISGSSYHGEWNALGMNGYGKYTFLHGVIYEGGMKDGQFHGEGKLIYPRGQEIRGLFYKGRMVTTHFTFKHGQTCVLEDYCKFPDRRFMSTIESGQFLPPGRERLTNVQPTRKIPKGHYDVGDGFYDPKTKWVYDASSFESAKYSPIPTRVPLRLVKPIETDDYEPEGIPLIKTLPYIPIYHDEEFITKHCRKEWDEPTGYRPDLYEKWMNGRRKEVERYRAKYGCTAQKDTEESNCLKVLHYMQEVVENERQKCLHFTGQEGEEDRQKSIV